MGKDRKLSADEQHLFRTAMADVRPISTENRIFHPKSPTRRAPALVTDPHQLTDDLFSEQGMDEEVAGEFYARPGLQHKLVRRFKQGQIPVEAELDLHGQRSIEARQSLTRFLHAARSEHCRLVRVIHGKGNRSENAQGVLRHKVWQWLRQHPDVLALAQAQPRDGGSGAVYILLRRGH